MLSSFLHVLSYAQVFRAMPEKPKGMSTLSGAVRTATINMGMVEGNSPSNPIDAENGSSSTSSGNRRGVPAPTPQLQAVVLPLATPLSLATPIIPGSRNETSHGLEANSQATDLQRDPKRSRKQNKGATPDSSTASSAHATSLPPTTSSAPEMPRLMPDPTTLPLNISQPSNIAVQPRPSNAQEPPSFEQQPFAPPSHFNAQLSNPKSSMAPHSNMQGTSQKRPEAQTDWQQYALWPSMQNAALQNSITKLTQQHEEQLLHEPPLAQTHTDMRPLAREYSNIATASHMMRDSYTALEGSGATSIPPSVSRASQIHRIGAVPLSCAAHPYSNSFAQNSRTPPPVRHNEHRQPCQQPAWGEQCSNYNYAQQMGTSQAWMTPESCCASQDAPRPPTTIDTPPLVEQLRNELAVQKMFECKCIVHKCLHSC